MKTIKNLFAIILFFLLCTACVYLYLQNGKLKNNYYDALTKAPDTVYVKTPYEVIKTKIEYREKPVLVEVYKPDTNLRNTMEQGTLITGIEYKKKFFKRDILKVHTITPQGSILINTYNADDLKAFKINPIGETEIRRKNKLIKPIVIGGTVTVSLVTVSAILLYKNKIKK